jgi:uncharacterized protein YjbI with pentapeptide repeats
MPLNPNIRILNYKENKQKTINDILLRYTNLCQDIINCIIIPYSTNNDLIGINLSHCLIYTDYYIHYEGFICDFCNVDMRYSNLSYVNIIGINLSHVDFSYSNLDGLNWSMVDLSKHNNIIILNIKMNNCSLITSKFNANNTQYEVINGIQIRNSDMRGSNFKYCKFQNCDFSGSDLRGIKLWHTEFYRCNFNNCNMREIDFRKAIINAGTFHNTNLEYSNLEYNNIGLWYYMEEDPLYNAKITGAKTNCPKMYKRYPQMSYVGRITFI